MSDSNEIYRLDGRRVVVTGGARGIGYAISRRAAASGAAVALLDLEQVALDQAAAQLRHEVEGAAILAQTCDVSSYDDIRGAREVLEAGRGRADVSSGPR